MKIDNFQLGLGFHRQDEGNPMAFICKFIGKVKKSREMSHCKPWVHHEAQTILTVIIFVPPGVLHIGLDFGVVIDDYLGMEKGQNVLHINLFTYVWDIELFMDAIMI